ncbi:MAG TPA: helix-turn-helix transcriptional regulator [Oleiagrimonas sp.]|nr:helix-turn-helix transcriptional regulator [Oleiagrimonas sp.]
MDIIRTPGHMRAALRTARLQQGLTQADVARKIGISPQAMSRQKNTERASFERVHRLATVLGLEITLRPKSAIADQANPVQEW